MENMEIKTLIQFIKFGMVGATNTLVSYGVNVLVIFLLRQTGVYWDYIAGNVVAFIFGVLWSFLLNSKFVFKKEKNEKRNTSKAIVRTYISYAFTCVFLASILSHFWIELLGISKYIAPLINAVITVPINFLLNKYWAFRTEMEENK